MVCRLTEPIFLSYSFSLSNRKTKNTARSLGDNSLLVSPNDSDGYEAAIAGNYWGTRNISLSVQFDSHPIEAATDSCSNHRHVFADSAREDQRIQTFQRPGHGANEFFCLITKQGNGLGGADVSFSRNSSSRMSELISETPSKPDSWLIMW